MGSGKRKYNHRGKYIPKEKRIGKYVEEEKKETPDPEKVKELLSLWSERKKKKEEDST
ncbi:hypothetical protein HYX16_03270 [Candidatus Woesearchaeota archaeon]|nr:hypothetical protein [Candidatus Woesearchaeota archaeon]